jgi:hypothetical protein
LVRVRATVPLIAEDAETIRDTGSLTSASFFFSASSVNLPWLMKEPDLHWENPGA